MIFKGSLKFSKMIYPYLTFNQPINSYSVSSVTSLEPNLSGPGLVVELNYFSALTLRNLKKERCKKVIFL